jgi:hypothetical protein
MSSAANGGMRKWTSSTRASTLVAVAPVRSTIAASSPEPSASPLVI